MTTHARGIGKRSKESRFALSGRTGSRLGMLVVLVALVSAFLRRHTFAPATKDVAHSLAAMALQLTAAAAVVLAGSALAFCLRRYMQQGTRGRGRLSCLALCSLIYGCFALAKTVAQGVTSAQTLSAAVAALQVAEVTFSGLVVASAISCWFLLSRSVRRATWWTLDALAIAAWLIMSFLPLPQMPEVARESLRLGFTAWVTARLLIRALPLALQLLERLPVQLLIAARHLRSRKSGFLGAIAVLSVLAVSVSSCALTTTLSVMGGFRNDLKTKILGNNAHILVDRKRGAMTDWRKIARRIESTPGVAGASPLVQGEVMISSASNFGGAVIRGVDPLKARKVLDLHDNLRAGTLEALTEPAPSEDEAIEDELPAVIVGQELAKSLRLSTGDEVNIVSPLGTLGPSGPLPKARAFRVAGVFYSGMYEYDMKNIYIALSEAQRFLNMGDAISAVEVKTRDFERAEEIASDIRNRVRGAGLRVQDWKQLNKTLFSALALEKLAMFIALGIAVLVASFCIIGTLTLMVQEKNQSIGVLKALGADDRTIIGIFLFEGLLIGLIGAASGLGLGYLACFCAKHFGIRMNPEVYYIDQLPVHIDSSEFIFVGAAALIVSFLVTVYPSMLASRVHPVEALRYE